MADDNSDKTAAESKAATNNELPKVDSPPLSPAGGEPSVAPEPKVEPKIEPAVSPLDGGEAKPLPAAARFKLRPRHKRYAVLAAAVTLAACIGAIAGALTTAPAKPPVDTAALQSALRERQALTQSIDKLNKDIAALKLDIETGSKSARSQIAKISERLNTPPEPQTTGSITSPAVAALPTPQPRPDMRPELRPEPPRPVVLQDWRIFDVRNGRVAVEGHGEVFEIGIGAPLPGLGPVQQIKRDGGRWVVTTPKGIIVSQRDRRYFD
jgi:hypothetical protein